MPSSWSEDAETNFRGPLAGKNEYTSDRHCGSLDAFAQNYLPESPLFAPLNPAKGWAVR